ncbi:required for excision 1-B domain-containing protein [Notechis scutatus]|uniref:Required for excision 1-B domain-containing protein n=1 Tax=Notechis scutatus TaxID=8663 RepID=A0A6J1VKA9_9SAUR|nr:required for excision 1-B domain-containing protein [Notechis scutatus]
MDVQSLVRRFYTLQAERVEAYRLLEEIHAEDFSEKSLLRNPVFVRALGSCCPQFYALLESFRQKLVMAKTAQLQLAKQNVQDQPGVEANTQEVQELKHKLIQTIEAISEILQDFKYDSEESS